MGSLELDNNYVDVFNALNVFLFESTVYPDIDPLFLVLLLPGGYMQVLILFVQKTQIWQLSSFKQNDGIV